MAIFSRTLAGAALGATILVSAPVFAEETINVMLWGVTWQDGVQAVAKKFTEKTGINVKFQSQASAGEGLVKLQTLREKSDIDVWFTTASVSQRASEDKALFVPIPADKMSNLKNLSKGAASDYYVAAYAYPMSIVYRTDLVKEPITSYQDLWTRADLKGKIGFPAMGFYQGRGLMMASIVNGGSSTDADKGFEALKKLKPQIATFLTSDAQARTGLSQGEIAVAVGTPALGKRVSDAGLPIKVVSPKPAIMNYDVMMMVKGKKQDAAAKFIDFVISDEMNGSLAAGINMAPVNVNAQPSKALVEVLPKEEDKVSLDEGFVNKNIAAWTERFNNEIAK